jgi:hypothetical protein
MRRAGGWGRLVLTLVAAPVFAAASGAGERDAADPSGDRDVPRLYESAAGRFRVLLPTEPELDRRTRRTWLGQVEDLLVRVERDGDRWVVEIHDIPPVATRFMPSGIILDRARKGFLADHGRVEIEHRDVVRDGRPAQHVRYLRPEDPDCERVGLIVLVDSRLYIVTARDSATARESLHPERFLESFAFWDEASPPPRPSYVAPPPEEG